MTVTDRNDELRDIPAETRRPSTTSSASLGSRSAISAISGSPSSPCGRSNTPSTQASSAPGRTICGRALPPSGILNRVLIAVQNPGALTKGTLEIVDAFYDIRHSFNNSVPSFSLAGYSGADPITIQNMPEEQAGAVYGAGDGSFV